MSRVRPAAILVTAPVTRTRRPGVLSCPAVAPARPAGELESELRDRHALDAALVAISRRLVGASSDTVDRAIEAALRILAEAMGTDRTYVSRLAPDGAHLTVTHEFHAAGRAALRAGARDLSTAGMEWVFDPLRARQVVVVRSLDEVPADQVVVRRAMEHLDLRGFVVAPMILAERVVGTIGFERSTRAPPLVLSTAPLVLAGELIAEVLARAEHELRITRDRLRSFVSSTGEAVVCFEPAQGIPLDAPFEAMFEQLQDAPLVECNTAYARMKGVDHPDRLAGKTLRELTAIPTDQLRGLFQVMVAGGYRVENMEVTGTEGTFMFGGLAMVSEGRLTHWWSLLRDVTEQRKAEAQRAALQAQLRHAQKMESIGLLAGGVAHDFNNILLVIEAESSIALEELRADPEAADADRSRGRRALRPDHAPPRPPRRLAPRSLLRSRDDREPPRISPPLPRPHAAAHAGDASHRRAPRGVLRRRRSGQRRPRLRRARAGGVPGLPRPAPRLRAPPLRRLPRRAPARLLVQDAHGLPVLLDAAHGADGGLPGGPRAPRGAGPAVGARAAVPPGAAARRAARGAEP